MQSLKGSRLGAIYAASICQRLISYRLKKHASGWIDISRSLYSGLTPLFGLTWWRTLLEFLILWRRPSIPDSYKNIFQNDHNITNRRSYSNPDTSLTSVISPDPSLLAQISTCSKKDTSFPLGCTNQSASGGELGSVNLQSYSPTRKARHSLIKELGLDRVAKITAWKKKLDDRIQTRESVVCKLRKKYMAKNLKKVVSWTVILWYSLFCLSECRDFKIFGKWMGTVGISQMVGEGASRKWCWLCPSWNVALSPICFSGHYFPTLQTNLTDHSNCFSIYDRHQCACV